ncbi:MAG: FKBP-type peptidyl-prolyl cis-trans isomerase N-terminal domain-containing protein, partial [Bacteroidales bacterium]|nr:FKBP-type peptidyl-prolyl cis-trans isomerase N-terminal domain-containing protein [Bacteroidales bacterium]
MITTELDKASYALGMNLGASLKNEGIETINAELLAQGIVDMLANNALQLSITEASQVV